jgi:hypothetical protein
MSKTESFIRTRLVWANLPVADVERITTQTKQPLTVSCQK